MIIVIILAALGIGIALILFVAFVAVVFAIHSTDRRHALRQPGHGRIDVLTRRMLGVYADRPRCKGKSAESDYTRR